MKSIILSLLVVFLVGCAHTPLDAPFCTKPLPKAFAKYDCDVQKKAKKQAKKSKEAEEAERLKQEEIQRQEEEEENGSVNELFKNTYAEFEAQNAAEFAALQKVEIAAAKLNNRWDWSEKDRIRKEEEEWEEEQQQIEERREDELSEIEAYRQSIRDMINERQ